MNVKDLSEYSDDQIESLMSRIPFFKELHQQDREQLDVLLSVSCIVELKPGETIMRRGERGSWLYFLIKGRLAVYLDDVKSSPLNYITPGELFGDLALLCDHERKATVSADKLGGDALLFATDFKPFGDVLNFDKVDLQTKLIFYRTMVHSIRWRLEVNRMESPSSELAIELRQAPMFVGEKGGEEELQSLHQQAQFLASILNRWNSESGNIGDVTVVNAASVKN